VFDITDLDATLAASRLVGASPAAAVRLAGQTIARARLLRGLTWPSSYRSEDPMHHTLGVSICALMLGAAVMPACGSGGGTTGTSTGGADPAQLDAPPKGQGIQFGTPEFEVPGGTEE